MKKLFRMMAAPSAPRRAPAAPRGNGFHSVSRAASPTPRRSSLSRVPATPWSHVASEKDTTGGSGTTKAAAAKAVKTAYVALGSNMGDRIAMIEHACNELSSRGIKVKRTSSLWETKPMYVLDQGNFVNGVCEVSPQFFSIPYQILLTPFITCLSHFLWALLPYSLSPCFSYPIFRQFLTIRR